MVAGAGLVDAVGVEPTPPQGNYGFTVRASLADIWLTSVMRGLRRLGILVGLDTSSSQMQPVNDLALPHQEAVSASSAPMRRTEASLLFATAYS